MAATISSVWAKPGAWALDSEQHEDELNRQIIDIHQFPEPPAADFPSLSAVATKPKKKNKAQTLSLAEFTNYTSSAPKPASSFEPKRLTQDELLMLPTGPRERTADELDRTRLGGGFRNYYGGMGMGDSSSRSRVSDRNREGYNSNSNRERDMGPSRADEVDDWSKTKKFGSFNGGSGSGNERSERREKVGFFNSSRADEVDNWASRKSFAPPLLEGARTERRMGFEPYSNGLGPDSDTWGRKKEERAVDSDTWGRKKEEMRENDTGNGVGRPRLNLQPRTLPVVNNGQGLSPVEGVKPKGANPFGEARPREEVLAEKGKDWKEIDEKLETLKMKEVSAVEKGHGFSKRRGFGMGRPESGDDKTVRSWRNPESNDVPPPSSEEETEKIAELTEDSANTEEVPGGN